LDADRILCTPSGASKGHLRPGDLVVVDQDGKSIGPGRPSSEIHSHLRALRIRPDANAVIHAHPPYATGFASAGLTLPDDVIPEASMVLGKVALVPFAMPCSSALADALEPWLTRHKTFLLANHGALTLGSNIEDAGNRMETLERIAHVVFVARALGGLRSLPPDVARQLRHAAEAYELIPNV